LPRWSAEQLPATGVDRSTLVERFETALPQILERLTALGRDTAVPHPLVGSVSLGALLEMAILETTIHLLDVIDAVGGPTPEPRALARTRNILADVPDPRTFIEVASGRSQQPILPVMR
jgi:hypothetical protein